MKGAKETKNTFRAVHSINHYLESFSLLVSVRSVMEIRIMSATVVDCRCRAAR